MGVPRFLALWTAILNLPRRIVGMLVPNSPALEAPGSTVPDGHRQTGLPRSTCCGLDSMPAAAPTTPPTTMPGGPPMMPIPAPMPAPESPRSPVAVPQPDNRRDASIPIATIRILEPLRLLFVVRARLLSKRGGNMTRAVPGGLWRGNKRQFSVRFRQSLCLGHKPNDDIGRKDEKHGEENPHDHPHHGGRSRH